MKSVQEKINSLIGKDVLVRSYASGVHIGKIEAYDMATRIIILNDARRLWQWTGAFTLSAVARNGVEDAKISTSLPFHIVMQVEEIIPLEEKIVIKFNNIEDHKI